MHIYELEFILRYLKLMVPNSNLDSYPIPIAIQSQRSPIKETLFMHACMYSLILIIQIARSKNKPPLMQHVHLAIEHLHTQRKVEVIAINKSWNLDCLCET